MTNLRLWCAMGVVLALSSCEEEACEDGTRDVEGACVPDVETPEVPDPPTVTTVIDTYTLDVTVTVTAAPGPPLEQSIHRRVEDGPWEDLGEPQSGTVVVVVDSPRRGVEVTYRARTLGELVEGVEPSARASEWSAPSTETVVPLQGVSVVRAVDAEPDGDLDQADLEAALGRCYAMGGCNLVLEEGTYDDVELKIGEFHDYDPATDDVYEALADGFALVGQGAAASVLRGRVYPTDRDARATLLLDTVPFEGWVFMGFALQGRKQDQPAPDLGVQVGNSVGLLTAPPAGYDLPGYNTAPFIPNMNLAPGYEKVDLLVHDLEVRDYMGAGIAVRDIEAPRVLDNLVENLGCHHACESRRDAGFVYSCTEPFVGLPDQDPETLCGANLGREGIEGWDASFPDSVVPGTKSNGFGIGYFGGITGGLIEGNVVRFATKIGIELFGAQSSCTTDGVTVRDNEVHDSSTGFTNNGGCHSVFVGNLAQENGLPGQDYTASIGRGFVCGGRGEHNQWLDNISMLNNSSGYALGCWGEDDDDDGVHVADVAIEGNRSVGNCMGVGAGQGAADFSLSNPVASRGFTITNHSVEEASRCEAGLSVRQVQEVTVSEFSVDASRHPSVAADDAVFDRVVALAGVGDSTFALRLQIADYDIARAGYYDFSDPLLRDVQVTVGEESSEGGVLSTDYTVVGGSAAGRNVTHNGVLIP